ncbi:MAG: hypothetical protein U0271_09720 [Polyangiaceae bacterium]
MLRSARRSLTPRLLGALVLVCSSGCAAGNIPDPNEALTAYAEAAASGDADRLYEMLSEQGKRQYTRDQIKAMVGDQKGELKDQATAITSPGVRIKTEATVKYADGEQAALTVEDGTFKISAADALPAEARSPVQALNQLRRVLARRSYAGLIRVLTTRSRAAFEEDLRSLVEGLEDAEGLDVEVNGDTATVLIPGGHAVQLRRENGVWHVEDLE